MKIIKKILFVLLLISNAPSIIRAQTKSGDNVIDSLKSQPAFTIYGDNYLITGTTIGHNPTSYNSDAKFQIGFKQLLVEFYGFFDTSLFLNYRQVTFWDIYQNSFPFRDNNYNPSIVLRKIITKNRRPFAGMWFALEHESNGLSGDNSRSWNYASIKYETKLSNDLYGYIKGWIPLGVSGDNDNDLLDYKSNFEVSLVYYRSQKLIFESELRRSFTTEWLGKIMLTANYRLSQNKNQFIYLQYFNGYAESLIDYQQHVNVIRIGIAFKDLSWLIFD